MAEYYCIPTATGRARLANLEALGEEMHITQMVIGDGNGVAYYPVDTQTVLAREVWRGVLNRKAIDAQNPYRRIFEAAIPATVGGFVIREGGLIDKSGALVAIARIAESPKPVLEQGQTGDLLVRLILEHSKAAVINMTLDMGTVLVSANTVNDLLGDHDKNPLAHDGLEAQLYYFGQL